MQCIETQVKQYFLLGSLQTIFHLVSVKAVHESNWGLFGERALAFSMLTDRMLLLCKLHGDWKSSVADSEDVPTSQEEEILLRF